MECPFVVGQQVVCVMPPNSHWVGQTHYPEFIVPIRYNIYTIREIRPLSGSIGLLFVEIHNRPMTWAEGIMEGGFHHSYFRALKKRKNENIAEIFIHTPTKVTENA